VQQQHEDSMSTAGRAVDSASYAWRAHPAASQKGSAPVSTAVVALTAKRSMARRFRWRPTLQVASEGTAASSATADPS